MKKFLEKIVLITIVVTACNSARAVFTDIPNDIALLHCDSVFTNWWGAPNTNSYWLVTPDDNSSGRESLILPILNNTNGNAFAMESATIPALMPGSPYGGSYLHFDGSNDSIFVNSGWLGDASIFTDFSFRWLGLPPDPADNFASVFACIGWRCYLKNANDGQHGFLQFLLEDGDVFFPSSSPTYLLSNIWYDVHFQWYEHNMTLIIGNSSNGYTTNTAYMSQDLNGMATQLLIGYPLWVPTRIFNGDLDEIRYGYVVPEPFLFLIYYLPFIIYYRMKFNSKN